MNTPIDVGVGERVIVPFDRTGTVTQIFDTSGGLRICWVDLDNGGSDCRYSNEIRRVDD